MALTIKDIYHWLKGLCEDDFPEDQICKGDPGQIVKNVADSLPKRNTGSKNRGIAWIELGHYASEIIGLRRVARDIADQFPQLSVSDYVDGPRVAFL